jgi:hypothetical protein
LYSRYGVTMAFDDILEPNRKPVEIPKPNSQPKVAKKPVDNLLGNLNAAVLAKRLGLNEELSQQVIIPLMALLDKHGGKIIEEDGPTASTIGTVSNLMQEFGPLIQGAYKYFSGVKTQLNEADAALLEANAAALSATELNSLFGSNTDIVDATEEPQAEIVTSTRNNPNMNPVPFEMKTISSAPKTLLETGKVDYYELLGVTPSSGNNKADSDIYSRQQENLETSKRGNTGWKVLGPKESTVVSNETLAEENGFTSQEVRNSDANYQMSGGDVTDFSMDLHEATPTQLEEGVSDILQMMEQEKTQRSFESKNPEDAYPTMTAEELVGHIRNQARVGAGGQTSTDDNDFKRKKISNYGDWQPPQDTFNIRGGEQLVRNAFNIGGLAEAMAEENDQRKRESKGEYNDSRTPDTLRIEGLEEAMTSQNEAYQDASKLDLDSVDSKEWSMGSLNDLSPEELGLEDYELGPTGSDPEAASREPKKGQVR